MIICTKCGFQNVEGASFCGSCGSFLEWTGEKVETEAPAAPEPSAPAEPKHEGVIDQARRVLGLDGLGGEHAPGGESAPVVAPPAVETASPTVMPAPPVPEPVVVSKKRIAEAAHLEEAPAAPPAPPPAPSPADAPPPPPWAVAPMPPPPPDMPQPPLWWNAEPATAAAPAPVPVPPAQPASVKPEAVKPAAAVQPDAVKPAAPLPKPAPTPAVAAETPHPGELICGQCGVGNEPARRFCRRCGTSLTAAPVAPARVPWWRRIFTRGRKSTPAGTRPRGIQQQAAASAGGRGSSVARLFGLILVGALVAGVAGFFLVPGFHDAVTGAADQVRIAVAPNYVPVNTAGAASGPSVPGHGPGKAFDGFYNTYWSAPPGAVNPAITAHFSPPADIAKILLTPGDSDDFQAQPRPRMIRLDFADTKGNVVFTKQYELVDSKDFQTLDVDVKGATSITVTILTNYKSVKGDSVSITEMEFRTRK